LIADYGRATAVEVLGATSHGQSFGGASAAFEEVTGEPLVAAVDRYEATYPACQAPRFRDDTVECGRDPLVLPSVEGEAVTTMVRLACDEPDTIGPRRGEIWRTLSLPVERAAYYAFEIYSTTGPENSATLRLTECGRSCYAEDEFTLNRSGVIAGFCLREQTYLLRIAAQAEQEVEVFISLKYLGESVICGE
jgi:hypothetical protein